MLTIAEDTFKKKNKAVKGEKDALHLLMTEEEKKLYLQDIRISPVVIRSLLNNAGVSASSRTMRRRLSYGGLKSRIPWKKKTLI